MLNTLNLLFMSDVVGYEDRGLRFYTNADDAYIVREVVEKSGVPIYWVNEDELHIRKETGEHWTCTDFDDYGTGPVNAFQCVYWGELQEFNEEKE